LIADFSGRAVVRLTSAERVNGARSRGVERAETVPLAGTLYDRVLRTQQTDVQPVDDGARMIAPFTTRCDAIGDRYFYTDLQLQRMARRQGPGPLGRPAGGLGTLIRPLWNAHLGNSRGFGACRTFDRSEPASVNAPVGSASRLGVRTGPTPPQRVYRLAHPMSGERQPCPGNDAGPSSAGGAPGAAGISGVAGSTQ
jgi:hypothetical protein